MKYFLTALALLTALFALRPATLHADELSDLQKQLADTQKKIDALKLKQAQAAKPLPAIDKKEQARQDEDAKTALAKKYGVTFDDNPKHMLMHSTCVFCTQFEVKKNGSDLGWICSKDDTPGAHLSDPKTLQDLEGQLQDLVSP